MADSSTLTSSEAKIENSLWNGTPDSVDNPEQLYQLYTMYVNSAQQISDRRAAANSYFQSINAGGTGVLGLFAAAGMVQTSLVLLLVLASLSLMCLAWMISLNSYRSLNSAKFNVINRLEAKLVASPFRTEWMLLSEGADPRVHVALTPSETLIPKIFIGLYVIVAVFILCNGIQFTDPSAADVSTLF
jgi:hypothetical protein